MLLCGGWTQGANGWRSCSPRNSLLVRCEQRRPSDLLHREPTEAQRSLRHRPCDHPLGAFLLGERLCIVSCPLLANDGRQCLPSQRAQGVTALTRPLYIAPVHLPQHRYHDHFVAFPLDDIRQKGVALGVQHLIPLEQGR